MKKLSAILAVAALMAACNNSSEETTTKTDSTATSNPAMDAMKTEMMADSTRKVDSAHQMTDSINKMK